MKKISIVEHIDADGHYIMVRINDRLEKCYAWIPNSPWRTKFGALRSALIYAKALTQQPKTKILREYETFN